MIDLTKLDDKELDGVAEFSGGALRCKEYEECKFASEIMAMDHDEVFQLWMAADEEQEKRYDQKAQLIAAHVNEQSEGEELKDSVSKEPTRKYLKHRAARLMRMIQLNVPDPIIDLNIRILAYSIGLIKSSSLFENSDAEG